jgi:hypothetical protein
MARLVQRIYVPDLPTPIPIEVEVGLAPLAWCRQFPTHVRVEGEVDPTLLQEIIEYVERFGVWRWDEREKKFYPVA